MLTPSTALGDFVENAVPAPAFTHQNSSDWINSAPLKLANLHGHVVLIDFWTFECWNCYRSFPWLNALKDRINDPRFQVISVHSPETDAEKNRKRVAAKATEFGLKYPIMIDNDFSYWHAFGNRFWPAFYLIDGQGRIRAAYVGETHPGDSQARSAEAAIRKLLSELPAAPGKASG